MHIYAVRDRLLDYFKPPFVAPSDKQVLAGFAQVVNNGSRDSDIEQAPHHFEIWRVATVTEEGRVVESREFLADCSSLIRPGVREGGAAGAENTAGTEGGSGGAPRRPGTDTGADNRPVQSPVQGPKSTAHPGYPNVG